MTLILAVLLGSYTFQKVEILINNKGDNVNITEMPDQFLDEVYIGQEEGMRFAIYLDEETLDERFGSIKVYAYDGGLGWWDAWEIDLHPCTRDDFVTSDGG